LTWPKIGLRYSKAMASPAHAFLGASGKTLFRIGEVSRLTATKAFVLRYWETEFPMLQPVKAPSGQRLYRREDIEMVFEIKRLLYDEELTIRGARKHLARENGGKGSARTVGGMEMRQEPASRARRKFLLDLHDELKAVLTLLKRE
jgi:DNA-binding transcriptional MerR regulator